MDGFSYCWLKIWCIYSRDTIASKLPSRMAGQSVWIEMGYLYHPKCAWLIRSNPFKPILLWHGFDACNDMFQWVLCQSLGMSKSIMLAPKEIFRLTRTKFRIQIPFGGCYMISDLLLAVFPIFQAKLGTWLWSLDKCDLCILQWLSKPPVTWLNTKNETWWTVTGMMCMIPDFTQ